MWLKETKKRIKKIYKYSFKFIYAAKVFCTNKNYAAKELNVSTEKLLCNSAT
jgi:hypothetical protein